MTESTQAGAVSSGWQVESQTEDVIVDAGGRAVRGIRVAFVTGNGVHGSVFVPMDRYVPDTVRALVAAHAADLDAVSNLSAPGT